MLKSQSLSALVRSFAVVTVIFATAEAEAGEITSQLQVTVRLIQHTKTATDSSIKQYHS